jgi:hypothetical protein
MNAFTHPTLWNDRENDQQCKLGQVQEERMGVDLNGGCWSVRRSVVAEQMSHGGSVAQPMTEEAVRR